MDEPSLAGRRLVGVRDDADLNAFYVHDGAAGLTGIQACACHRHSLAAHQFHRAHHAGAAGVDHVVVCKPSYVEAGILDGRRQGIRRIEDRISHVVSVALERGLHVAERQIRVLDIFLEIDVVPGEVILSRRRIIGGLELRRMAHDVAHRTDGQMHRLFHLFLLQRIHVEHFRFRFRRKGPEQDAGEDDRRHDAQEQTEPAVVDLYAFLFSRMSSHTLSLTGLFRTDTC